MPQNDKINVMVNGLPGKMASAIAERLLFSDEFSLVPFSLTAEETPERTYKIPMAEFVLVKPSERYEMFPKIQTFQEHQPFISVDYTHPSAVNDNADFYCRHNMHFVMGTTGGDRKALEERVLESPICAVIAPNMAAPIVSLMAFMDNYSKAHEGDFKGYELQITESHQAGKADTSGTAKAMVKYFNRLGIQFDEKQIKMIRTPEEQKKFGVPDNFLGGHGWHNYEIEVKSAKRVSPEIVRVHLTSPEMEEFGESLQTQFFEDNPALGDYNTWGNPWQEMNAASQDQYTFVSFHQSGINKFCITHNINGRSVYADGTLTAVRFLDEKIRAGEKGKVYTMIDVLKG